MSEVSFFFDKDLHKKLDCVPLSPILANHFVCCFQQDSLETFPLEFKHLLYRLSVNDIFVIFTYSHLTLLITIHDI